MLTRAEMTDLQVREEEAHNDACLKRPIVWIDESESDKETTLYAIAMDDFETSLQLRTETLKVNFTKKYLDDNNITISSQDKFRYRNVEWKIRYTFYDGEFAVIEENGTVNTDYLTLSLLIQKLLPE